MKNLEHELEIMREQLDEEYDAKQVRPDLNP